MRYFKFVNIHKEYILAVEVEGELYNVTVLDDSLQDYGDLLRLASLFGQHPDHLVRQLICSRREARWISAERLADSGWRPCLPIRPPEVWAAGVTYRISREERQRESRLPEVYARVYQAERPEIFFKATAERCSGPGEPIGVRGDSAWNVPEPELAFVLLQGEIVAFTIGNDVSSRSIEGENPLYLPQAKVYDSCCALGPCLVSSLQIENPHNLTLSCSIIRQGESIFRGEASTSQMIRSCRDLAGYLTRHNRVPDGTVMLTGTAIVPPEEVSLRAGDLVRIEMESIGVLENPVIEV